MKRAISLGATLILLTGCGSTPESAVTITDTDVQSAAVSINELPKFQRIVALANGSAEIIDSLGMKSYLIGRDIASTDESLKSIPIVTSGHQVVAEKIIALNPDLVIIDSSVGPSQALQSLKSAKIKIATIEEVWTVGEIAKKVRNVADAIGAPKSGEALAQRISNDITALKKSVQGSPKIAFLYLRGGNSIYLLGGKGSGADSLATTLGAVDVGSLISSKPFVALTSESFAEQRPDILLVMIKGLESVGGVSGLVELPGIAQTPAGKNRRVIAVDDSLLLSFGPRTPDLLAQLAEAIKQVA
jgi:iron complex transport system substrate-binding protein